MFDQMCKFHASCRFCNSSGFLNCTRHVSPLLTALENGLLHLHSTPCDVAWPLLPPCQSRPFVPNEPQRERVTTCNRNRRARACDFPIDRLLVFCVIPTRFAQLVVAECISGFLLNHRREHSAKGLINPASDSVRIEPTDNQAKTEVTQRSAVSLQISAGRWRHRNRRLTAR